MTDKLMWESGCGRLSLDLTPDDAAKGYHSGACDQDITELMADPRILAQLEALDPELVRQYLREYGCWDDWELQSAWDNHERVLWLACGDLVDGGN